MKGSIALLTTLGFLSILGALAFGPTNASEDNPAVLILFGSLASGWGAVISYYFGSAEQRQALQRSTDEPKKPSIVSLVGNKLKRRKEK